MPFTVTRSAFAAVCLALFSTTAIAGHSDQLPLFVQDAVLGLRLPDSAKLDLVPEEVRAKCEQMADNDMWTGRVWTFGMVKHATGTYYLANGYFKRRNPKPGERLYHQPEVGGLYRLSDGRCNGDQAEEMFEVRDPDQIPLAVLKELANDMVARLIRALGGENRLRAEIANQRLDFHMLSPELQEAFKPYFPPRK
jgi:hypothetical protein